MHFAAATYDVSNCGANWNSELCKHPVRSPSPSQTVFINTVCDSQMRFLLLHNQQSQSTECNVSGLQIT